MDRILGSNLGATIRTMQDQLDNFQTYPIGIMGDWYEIAEPVVYTNSSTITVSNTNVDLTKMFAKGDPIRLKQGGSYKYFYVYSLTATTLRVNGGSAYTLTNAAITDLARGLKLNPSGHPVLLTYAPNIVASTGTYSNLDASQYELARYMMVGNLVILKLNVTFGSLTNNATLRYDIPIPNGNPNFIESTIISIVNNFNFSSGFTKFGTTTTGEIYGTTIGGQFSATTNGLAFTINLIYGA